MENDSQFDKQLGEYDRMIQANLMMHQISLGCIMIGFVLLALDNIPIVLQLIVLAAVAYESYTLGRITEAGLLGRMRLIQDFEFDRAMTNIETERDELKSQLDSIKKSTGTPA